MHAANEKLKKFSGVNKRAFDQFSEFTTQREELDGRREELTKSEESIRDLIEHLDQRKDEAIERTFKQVSKNFVEVFESLVPTGRGRLIMQKRIDDENESEEELELDEDEEQDDEEEKSENENDDGMDVDDEEESETAANKRRKKGKSTAKTNGKTNGRNKKANGNSKASKKKAKGKGKQQKSGTIESYTGVSIKVSFNSKSDEGLRIQQLSGGQKSLVALALIFSIQKCDPAPFYLFDEIDANLDADRRTAVAGKLHLNSCFFALPLPNTNAILFQLNQL